MSNLLTIAEAAKELRLSERTIRKRVASGELLAWRLGPEKHAPVRIHRNHLDAFLEPAARDTEDDG